MEFSLNLFGGEGPNYLMYILSKYLWFSKESVHVSSTLRAEESSTDVAKKSPAPPGWRTSKDTIRSTFPPLLLPYAFVSTFLTCFFSHFPFISLVSLWITHLRMSVTYSHILSIS